MRAETEPTRTAGARLQRDRAPCGCGNRAGISQTRDHAITRRALLRASAASALAAALAGCGGGTRRAPALLPSAPGPPGAGAAGGALAFPLRFPLTAVPIGAPDGNSNSFPAIARAANGDLLVVFRKAPHLNSPPGAIHQSRSRDGGRSWSPPALALSPSGSSYGTPNADLGAGGLTLLDDGSLLMTINQTSDGTAITAWTSRSTDHGASWSAPRQLPLGFIAGTLLQNISSPAIALRDGSLLCATYGSDVKGTYDLTHYYVRVLRSTDHGQHWSLHGEIRQPPIHDRGYAEPNLQLLRDGRILCAFRVERSGVPAAYIASSFSSDGGRTWTAPQQVLSGTDANPALAIGPDGDLWMLTRESAGELPYMVSSRDGGLSWGPHIPASVQRGFWNYGMWVDLGPRGRDGNLGFVSSENGLSGGADVFFVTVSRELRRDPGVPGDPYRDRVLRRRSLAAVWTLGERLGATVAADYLGRSPGRFTGPVKPGQPGLVRGGAATATQFVATGACNVPSTPALRAALGAPEFTIECVCRPDAAALAPNASAMLLTLAGYGVALQLRGGHAVFETNNGAQTAVAKDVLRAGATLHVAATKDASQLRLYINGRQVASASSAPLAAAQGQLQIGSISNQAGNFTGLIQDVTLDTVALDAATIAADARAAGAA